MNKKAFTTVELILTIVLVAIIMATITNVTFNYRDRSTYEKTKTELTNYKNKLTKIIYDDILDLNDKVVNIIEDSDNHKYQLITKSGIEKNLIIESKTEKVLINYDGVDYIIPDSNKSLIEITNINYKEDNVNNLYSLEIFFKHRNLEEIFKIRIVVSNS